MPVGHTTCQLVTWHAFWSHDMPVGHMACLLVTCHASWSHVQHASGHMTCLLATCLQLRDLHYNTIHCTNILHWCAKPNPTTLTGVLTLQPNILYTLYIHYKVGGCIMVCQNVCFCVCKWKLFTSTVGGHTWPQCTQRLWGKKWCLISWTSPLRGIKFL